MQTRNRFFQVPGARVSRAPYPLSPYCVAALTVDEAPPTLMGLSTTKIRRLVLGAGLALLLAVPSVIAARAFRGEYLSFRATPTPVPHAEARKLLPGLIDVSWRYQGALQRGWFVPGALRAAVVLLHGSGGTRADNLRELQILSRSGFSLLAFDWPGQGESGGVVQWGASEQGALHSALDWLSARAEVDPERIGAFGFSMGGVPLIREAVSDPRLRAIAVAGTPGNLVDFAHWEYRAHGSLAAWPAMLAMRLRGMPLTEAVPDALVAQLSPRPLLVVLGEGDDVVPPALTRGLYQAARQPKGLLELPKTGHGGYADSGVIYEERLTSFFEQALLGEHLVGPTQ